MLKKLMKYDLSSMFRLWWIGALVCLIMGVAGGFCWMIAASDRPIPDAVETICIILIVLAVFFFLAFSLFTTVIIFIRYFKNFFTDEGYLTFTLPVHRHTLLNAKLLSGLVMTLGAGLLVAVSAGIMVCIGAHEYIFGDYFWDNVKHIYRELSTAYGGYLWVYLAEGLVLFLLFQIISLVFLYLCITIGSTVAQKAKLVLSIGIYYGINTGAIFVLQLLVLFCGPSLDRWLSPLGLEEVLPVFALILLCGIFFLGTVCAFLYSLLNRMLARKLNLS